jgi:hypothetical protein
MANTQRKIAIQPIPVIYFEKYLNGWVEKTIPELHEEITKLKDDLCKVCKHLYSVNVKVLITGIYGRPCIQVGVYNNAISFWNYTTGAAITSFSSEEWDSDREGYIERVKSWVKYIDEGLNFCQVCGYWKKDHHQFGFAGSACDMCYDPKIHLPPDTSGD